MPEVTRVGLFDPGAGDCTGGCELTHRPCDRNFATHSACVPSPLCPRAAGGDKQLEIQARSVMAESA